MYIAEFELQYSYKNDFDILYTANYSSVVFKFDLRRKSGYYILTQIVPTIVITLLTIIGR
jgi:hypothetical protein